MSDSMQASWMSDASVEPDEASRKASAETKHLDILIAEEAEDDGVARLPRSLRSRTTDAENSMAHRQADETPPAPQRLPSWTVDTPKSAPTALQMEDTEKVPLEARSTAESRSNSKKLPSATPRMQAANDKLQNLLGKQNEDCTSGRTPCRSFRHGKIIFEETGQVCRYLVPPREDMHPEDLVAALIDPRFGLPKPELVVTVQNMDAHEAVEQMKKARKTIDASNKDKESREPISKMENERVPKDTLKKGKDASESVGKMDKVARPNDVPKDNKAAPSKREVKEYNRLVREHMMAICKTSIECGAWFVGFGQRNPGVGSGAAFEDGISTYLEQFPDKEGTIPFLGIGGPCNETNYKACGCDNMLNKDKFPAWATLITPRGDVHNLRDDKYLAELGDEPKTSIIYHAVTAPHKVVNQDITKSTDDEMNGVPGELTGNTGRDEKHGIARSDDQKKTVFGHFLFVPWLSHFLVCPDASKKKVLKFLERMVPAVHIVIGGHHQKAIEIACEKALRGQVILLNNTGVYVNRLIQLVNGHRERGNQELANKTLLRKRGHEEGHANPQKTLPRRRFSISTIGDVDESEDSWFHGINVEGRFLIYDINDRNLQRLERDLTRALTRVGGDDEFEMGFESSERERVFAAWAMVLAFEEAARFQWRLACACHYISVFISLSIVATTVIPTSSAVDAGAEVEVGVVNLFGQLPRIRLDQNALNAIRLICAVLPLISAAVVSAASYLSPQQTYLQLKAGAINVRSLIYMYRARVCDFEPSTSLFRRLQCRGKVLAMDQTCSSRTKKPDNDEGNDNDANETGGNQNSTQTFSNTTSRETEATYEQRRPRERFADALAAIHRTLNSGSTWRVSPPVNEDVNGAHYIQGEVHRIFNAAPEEKAKQKRCCKHFSSTMVVPMPATNQESDVANKKVDDDCWSLITAEGYKTMFVDRLLDYFLREAPFLRCTATLTRLLSITCTLLTGILSILGLNEWMPLALALAASIEATAQFHQISTRLAANRNSQEGLERLVHWWNGLSMVERRKASGKRFLVTETDAIVAQWQSAVYGVKLNLKALPTSEERVHEND